MSEENDPVSEISNFRSGTIYNWLPAGGAKSLVFEGKDGSLTAFKAGRLLSSKYYRRLYRVDQSWHSATLRIRVPHERSRTEITVDVQLNWRVTDAVAAVRGEVRDVDRIIRSFLTERFGSSEIHSLIEGPLPEIRISRELQEHWQHPALETHDFRLRIAFPKEAHPVDQTPIADEHRRLELLREIIGQDQIALRLTAWSDNDISDFLKAEREEAHERMLAALNEISLLSSVGFDPIELLRRIQAEKTDIPATIYLSDESGHEEVEAAVEQMLHAAGLDVAHRGDPIIGSWFRNLRARIRNFATTPLGQDATILGIHAAKNALVHNQEAEITSKLLENVGPVIESLNNINEAVIRVGAILVVKADGAISVNQLTPAQQQILYYRPQLLKTPRDILAALDPAQTTPANPSSLGDPNAPMREFGNGHEPPALPSASS